VLNLVAQEVSTILDAPMCVVRLLDKSGVFLKARAFAGTFFKNEFTLELFPVINIYNDVMGKVILDSEMHSTDIIEEEWLVYELNQLKEEHERITNVVLIPLINKSKKLGLIAVGAHRKMAESDVSLLWSIANNASVAVDNAILYDNSKKYFIKTIDALIATVEAKDKYTEGHSQRVARYAVEIAKSLKFDKERIEDLKIAGILHDIGKIGISDSILLKSGALTDFEFEQIKQHPIISKKILYPVGLSDRIIDTITYHHERYDGKGYPLGLSGHELQLEAQIIAVADTFDAITSNRSYRKAKSPDFAISELLRNRGTQLAPDVVDAMVKLYTKRKDLISQIMHDEEEATG
jgi:putative nucleotidyltransferase with HDIG domain